MTDDGATGGRDLRRGGTGALFLVVASLLVDRVEAAIYLPMARALGLHMIAQGELRLLPYGAVMLVRSLLDLAVVAGALAVLRVPWGRSPLAGPRFASLMLIGLGIGLLVMSTAILAMVLGGSATVSAPSRSAASAILHGAGWLAFDYLNAAGEELYGRVAVLLIADALLGRRGVLLVSGLMFSILHLGNPRSNPVWLLRILLQGMVLAYAVYSTGLIWWSIAYHTGWNWASAPLFRGRREWLSRPGTSA